jgi:hypothetical protein
MDFDAAAKRIMLQQRAERVEAKLHEADKATAEIAAVVTETIEREAEEATQEVGFSARLLVQATLPHSKPPPGLTEFQRSNGYVTINITSRKQFGLPYGTYPRLLLAWLTTEAVRTKSPELELGASLRGFIGKLGLPTDGGPQGTYPRLRQHMTRLFSSMVSATVERGGEIHNLAFCPVEQFSLFWDPQRPEQGALWQSTLRLNQTFYEEIVNKPVPVDMDVLRSLIKGRSPMAIDIYQWLTHRMSYLKKPTPIPWERLQLQFGCEYGATRDFKRAFLRHLKRVLELYPQARVSVERDCLRLLPGKTSVPMRLLKSRR